MIRATNSWLYAQTQQSQGRFDKDRGYVCTLSALILKQQQAHVFMLVIVVFTAFAIMKLNY